MLAAKYAAGELDKTGAEVEKENYVRLRKKPAKADAQGTCTATSACTQPTSGSAKAEGVPQATLSTLTSATSPALFQKRKPAAAAISESEQKRVRKMPTKVDSGFASDDSSEKGGLKRVSR